MTEEMQTEMTWMLVQSELRSSLSSLRQGVGGVVNRNRALFEYQFTSHCHH